MMNKTVKGNLITLAEEGNFDVIIHGCNCFHKMGKGIAREIKQRYPRAYIEDESNSKYADKRKLGSYTSYKTSRGFTIVNAYTQYDYRNSRNTVNLDYKAVDKVFKRIAEDFSDKRVGYPLIGAGLAKGDWKRIKSIIDHHLKDHDHTLVIYRP